MLLDGPGVERKHMKIMFKECQKSQESRNLTPPDYSWTTIDALTKVEFKVSGLTCKTIQEEIIKLIKCKKKEESILVAFKECIIELFR